MSHDKDQASSRPTVLPFSAAGQQLMLDALRDELSALQAVLARLPVQQPEKDRQMAGPVAADDLFDNLPV